ncbi:hypothetical protein FK219_012315, partial [Chryseoglobus sp. KN1116]|nr:hypothetical protein [Microcella pacifica]
DRRLSWKGQHRLAGRPRPHIRDPARSATAADLKPDGGSGINERLLADRDGPMLQYGLQAMDGKRLELPTRRDDAPDREFLAERFHAFSV